MHYTRLLFSFGAFLGDVQDNEKLTERSIATIIVEYILLNLKDKFSLEDILYLKNECLQKFPIFKKFYIDNIPISMCPLGLYFEKNDIQYLNNDIIQWFIQAFNIKEKYQVLSYINIINNIKSLNNIALGYQNTYSDMIINSKGTGSSMLIGAIYDAYYLKDPGGSEESGTMNKYIADLFPELSQEEYNNIFKIIIDFYSKVRNKRSAN